MKLEWLSGLAFAVALPVIAMLYMLKRNYIDTQVPSHFLWNRVLREWEANRPWQRLRSRLLLIIQLVAAALLVAALTGPFIWKAASVSRHIVLVLDESASMVAGTRLHDAVLHIQEDLKADRSGNVYTLIALREQPEVVVTKQPATAIKEALGQVKPAYGKAAYRETISLASALTNGDAGAEIRLYTDGQWPEPINDIPIPVPVSIRLSGLAEEPANLSIVKFGVTKPQSTTDGYSGVATVRNDGKQTLSADLLISSGAVLTETRRETFLPGEQRSIYMNDLPAADYFRARIQIQDTFAFDNEVYAFAARDRKKSALLLSDGSLFLEKALTRAGLAVIKPQKNGGVWPVPQAVPDLIVVDSIDTSTLETAVWKQLLAQTPVWRIGSGGVSGQSIQPDLSRLAIKEHPVTRYIRMMDAHIGQAIRPDPAIEGETVVSVDQTPLIAVGERGGIRSVWFTFDLHQSDLPLRFEFPVLVQNVTSWLLEGAGEAFGRLPAGTQKEISISSGAAHAVWISESEERSGKETAAAEIGGVPAAIQSVPEEPGFYLYVERDSQGKQIRSRYADVYADPRESGTSPVDPLTFTNSEGKNPQTTNGQQAQANQTPYRLVSWILAALLALILAEWEVYRRGYSL